MKKRLIIVLIALCLLVTLPTVCAAADTMTPIDVADPVVGWGYAVRDVQTNEETAFSYTIPGDGATVLVFYSTTCGNCHSLLQQLNTSEWLTNPYLNVVTVESDSGSQTAVQECLDTYIPDMQGHIASYYTPFSSLAWDYHDLISNSGWSWPLVVVITDSDSGPVVRCAADAMTSSATLYNTLCAVSSGFCSYEIESGRGPAQERTVRVAGQYDYTAAQDVFTLINEQRTKNGLEPLVLDPTLTQIAMQRATECALYYSHTRPNGENCSAAIKGYYADQVYNGENIAAGQSTAGVVMNDWMDSTGHRENILRTNSTHVGVGCAVVNGQRYWVQFFGKNIPNETSDSTTGQVPFEAEVITLDDKLSRNQDSRSFTFAMDSENELANQIEFSIPYTNLGVGFFNTVLIPQLSDITDADGNVIATLELADASSGTVRLTAVASGEGSVALPVYEGERNPFTVSVDIHTHDYKAVVTSPTCTSWGHTTYTCAHCEDSYIDDYTAPAYHSFGDWVITVKPTTGQAGEQERTCSGCGETETQALEKLPEETTKPTEPKPLEPSVPENPFVDVKQTHYHYLPVLWAVENRITTGTDATHFNPDSSCTRNQVVTFLWRAAGEPEPTSTKNPFQDVKSADYFYKAVLWAVENGITNGMDATHFGPNEKCTRAQVAMFLWRTLGEPSVSGANNPFKDVNAKHWFYEPVLWAVDAGVTNGIDATHFSPDSSCTRGQIVTFLYRALAE